MAAPTMEVLNPATEEVLAHVLRGSADDVDAAVEAARALQFGTVWINDHGTLVSEMPHGGFRQSGYGKDLSVYPLEEYTQLKHVMARLS